MARDSVFSGVWQQRVPELSAAKVGRGHREVDGGGGTKRGGWSGDEVEEI